MAISNFSNNFTSFFNPNRAGGGLTFGSSPSASSLGSLLDPNAGQSVQTAGQSIQEPITETVIEQTQSTPAEQTTTTAAFVPTPAPTPAPVPVAPDTTAPVNVNEVITAAPVPTVAPKATSEMIEAQIQGTLNAPIPEPKEVQQLDAADQQILDLQAQLMGQEAFAQSQEAFQQQQEFQKQLNEISGLVQQKQAQLGAFEHARDMEGGLGTFIRSDINDARRQAAIEINGLQAAASVAQGNMLIAQEQLQQAIDLKYNPIKEQIEYMQQVIGVRERQADRALDRADQERSDRLSALSRRFESLQADEEESKALLVQAGQNGANTLQISRALLDIDRGLMTPAQAVEQFGDFIFGPSEAEQLDLENQRLQNNLVSERIRSERASQYQLQNDIATQGLMTAKEISDMTKLEPVKKLEARAKFTSLLNQYRNIVEEVGVAVRGVDKGRMESVLGELQIAYKDAAGLGALVGADFDLLDRVIPNATSNNFAGKAMRSLRNQGKNQILSSLDETMSRNQTGIKEQLRLIEALDPRYTQTDYLDIILEPIANMDSDNQNAKDPLGVFGDTNTTNNDPLGIL